MSESNREHLSSLMDGELDRKAQKFLLRRISADEEMSATWRRFHTVRACLHQELLSTRDLTARVAAALADEPAPAGNSMPRWFRPLAGSAIAASVALVAVVGINSTLIERNQQDLGEYQPGFVSQSTSFDEVVIRQAVPVSYSETSQADRQRIGGYALRHHQAAGSAGFMSFVPIVSEMHAARAPEPEPAVEPEAASPQD